MTQWTLVQLNRIRLYNLLRPFEGEHSIGFMCGCLWNADVFRVLAVSSQPSVSIGYPVYLEMVRGYLLVGFRRQKHSKTKIKVQYCLVFFPSILFW